jgi:serine/threonine protein phosphatase 1
VTAAIDISGWRPAPFNVGGETVFAIGDVHGCARELGTLLAAIAELAGQSSGRRRLIYLGDLIDRGPDNLGVLRQWADDETACGVDRIDRLMGNHEQMLMLALAGGPYAKKAYTQWLTARMGGRKVLDEMRAKAERPDAELENVLVAESLGEAVVHQLQAMRSHVRLGNTLFVHGGLDPHADPDEFLARPWTQYTKARWAWINQGFLDWKDGFNGLLVVHGHTPPDKHRAISGMDDPHLFQSDRLGLDGGSARTGIVTAAEIRDGGYRILKAGQPIAHAA